MRPNFRPPRGFIVFLFLCLLTFLTLAADKRRKAPRSETSSKAKATQKVDPKAKATRDARRESDKKRKNDSRNQQLARQKKNDDKQDKRRGKAGSTLAANKREEKASSKRRARNAQREADRRDEKSKLAKKTEKADKKDVAAKKQPAEKAAKSSSKSEAGSELTKASHNTKADTRSQAKDDKGRDLPSAAKFTLRPVAKVTPKVELDFSLARAMVNQDAPPPRDLGPDVIDVIEHDSPEVRRLDEVLRADVKAVQFSSVPNISRKKVDVGRMDAERIKQIQEALARKGFYSGEIHGQYDDATVEAMRKFQESQKIDVTGYATAQSLRLLGLTDWE